MKPFLILPVFLMTCFSASLCFASHQLSVLKATEWTGECRSFVKATPKTPPALANQRTLSTYQMKGPNLLWTIKSFKDPQCTQLFNIDRYTLNCSGDEKSEYAQCKQIKLENSKDGNTWVEDKPVEQAGHSISMEL